MLALDFKKRNNCKILHSSANLRVNNSDIVEAFKYMHKSIMTEIKMYTCEDYIFLDVNINHSIKIFDC